MIDYAIETDLRSYAMSSLCIMTSFTNSRIVGLSASQWPFAASSHGGRTIFKARLNAQVETKKLVDNGLSRNVFYINAMNIGY